MPREFKNRWRTAGDEDLTSIPTILSAYQQSADSNLKIVIMPIISLQSELRKVISLE